MQQFLQSKQEELDIASEKQSTKMFAKNLVNKQTDQSNRDLSEDESSHGLRSSDSDNENFEQSTVSSQMAAEISSINSKSNNLQFQSIDEESQFKKPISKTQSKTSSKNFYNQQSESKSNGKKYNVKTNKYSKNDGLTTSEQEQLARFFTSPSAESSNQKKKSFSQTAVSSSNNQSKNKYKIQKYKNGTAGYSEIQQQYLNKKGNDYKKQSEQSSQKKIGATLIGTKNGNDDDVSDDNSNRDEWVSITQLRRYIGTVTPVHQHRCAGASYF